MVDDDGGDYESDNTPTLVDSESVDSDEEDETSEEPRLHEDVDATVPIDRPTPEEDEMEMDATPREISSLNSQSDWSQNESIDSLENHASSGANSIIISDGGRNDTVSQDGLYGVGDWARVKTDEARRFSGKHYFRQSPLRLSPQYEHCRGNAHMVIPDDAELLDSYEADWRRQTLGYDLAFWHNERLFSH